MTNDASTANFSLRPVFYASDGTGITAETIGHSLLTQFADVHFETRRLPFIDSLEKAEEARDVILKAHEEYGARPIVINTVIDQQVAETLEESGALMLDVMRPFLAPIQEELGVAPNPAVGKAHGVVDFAKYEARIEATNYALSHDDGVSYNYDEADVILVGVSRSGKTPTCLYMALHFGVRCGNYPLTEEDLEGGGLPPRLRQHKDKLFGLTIDPVRLQHIREIRRPGSKYASLPQCRFEVSSAESLFREQNIQALSTTNTSIEEIASKVLVSFGLTKKLY